MDRRALLATGFATLGAAATARGAAAQPQGPAAPTGPDTGPAAVPAQTYSSDELVNRVSDALGVTAEAAGGAVERIFQDNGRASGYIAGEEGSGAFALGLR